jgi:hypothetical protein
VHNFFLKKKNTWATAFGLGPPQLAPPDATRSPLDPACPEVTTPIQICAEIAAGKAKPRR